MTMRLVLAIFIYFVTVYQPAIAVVDVNTEEDIKLIPRDNGNAQSATTTPDSKANVFSQETRGQMLYENHCTSCHESLVYIRAKRKATNYKGIGYWVSQRADWLNLDWTALEKYEVLQYLNERYYKYPTTD